MDYEIFVSYRRTDAKGNISGRDIARLLSKEFKLYGYKTFFDYSELQDNDFAKIIIPAVQNCKIFVLVLTRDAMTRCCNEGDWVRQEIETAVNNNVKIITVNPDNSFDGWPESFPEELSSIKTIQMSSIDMNSNFEVTVKKMIDNRIVPILPPRINVNSIKCGRDEVSLLIGNRNFIMPDQFFNESVYKALNRSYDLKGFLNNDMDANQKWIGNHSFINDVFDSKLILFMIGSSAASIYSPLLRFFLSGIHTEYIIPIFIDRNFHSSSTSSAIEEIANYDEFCRLSLIKSVSTEPLLYVEDNIDAILRIDTLKQILASITTADKIFICTSVHSAFNTEITIQLEDILKSKAKASNISYGFFLPYLQFATNDRLSSILFKDNDEDRNATLNINLRRIWSAINKDSSAFIVGLSHKSIVTKSDYQINPFNIVHLIMAYAVSASSNIKGGWYEYSAQQANSFLSSKDIIQSDDFRNSLIIQDFSSLVYNFLLRENYLPEELKKDSKLSDSLQKYLNTTSKLVLSLGDATSNTEICMYLRNMMSLNTIDINLNFRKHKLLKDRDLSKKELYYEIYKYIDTSKIVNSNMAANQVISAINSFIMENFGKIANNYF